MSLPNYKAETLAHSVGVEHCTTAVVEGQTVSDKPDTPLLSEPVTPIFNIFLRITKHTYTRKKKDLCKSVLDCFIYKSPKLERAQVFNSQIINKQMMCGRSR